MNFLKLIGLLMIFIVLFFTSGVTFAQDSAAKSYDKGVEYAAHGKFNEAKQKFEKALRADSFYGAAKEALKVIKDVVCQKIKSKTAIHFFNAVVYGNNGQLDEAIVEFNKAIEISIMDPKI